MKCCRYFNFETIFFIINTMFHGSGVVLLFSCECRHSRSCFFCFFSESRPHFLSLYEQLIRRAVLFAHPILANEKMWQEDAYTILQVMQVQRMWRGVIARREIKKRRRAAVDLFDPTLLRVQGSGEDAPANVPVAEQNTPAGGLFSCCFINEQAQARVAPLMDAGYPPRDDSGDSGDISMSPPRIRRQASSGDGSGHAVDDE
jgi:hypothetical protein